jgi:hypothetical protein
VTRRSLIVALLPGVHRRSGHRIAHYREALELAESADEPQLLFPCYDGLATVHLDLGEEGRAEEFMQKAQAVCERAGLEPDALVVLPFLD